MEADPTTTTTETAVPATAPTAPTVVPKVHKTKTTMGPFNILSHLVSLPVVGAAVWLFCMRDYDCEELLRVNMPTVRMSMGFGLLLIFALSKVAVLAKGPKILPVFFVTMFLMIVTFIVGVALVGAYPMESRGVPGSPIWLKRRVTSNGNWNNIKACIYDSGICDDLAARTAGLSSYEFNTKRLSHLECRVGKQFNGEKHIIQKDILRSSWQQPRAVADLTGCLEPDSEVNRLEISRQLVSDCVMGSKSYLRAFTSLLKLLNNTSVFLRTLDAFLLKSGCCRPPAPCGTQFNFTWVVINDTSPAVGPKDTISSRWFFAGDCASWGNQEAKLCCGCQSCRRGYLATLRERWYKLGVVLIVIALILTLLHSVRFVVLMMQLHGSSSTDSSCPLQVH